MLFYGLATYALKPFDPVKVLLGGGFSVRKLDTGFADLGLALLAGFLPDLDRLDFAFVEDG